MDNHPSYSKHQISMQRKTSKHLDQYHNNNKRHGRISNRYNGFSQSYFTLLIVFSISMSPTGMRMPPNTARTAPMTAPAMSPQLRSQPILLAQQNQGRALVSHQLPASVTMFSTWPGSTIRKRS